MNLFWDKMANSIIFPKAMRIAFLFFPVCGILNALVEKVEGNSSYINNIMLVVFVIWSVTGFALCYMYEKKIWGDAVNTIYKRIQDKLNEELIKEKQDIKIKRTLENLLQGMKHSKGFLFCIIGPDDAAELLTYLQFSEEEAIVLYKKLGKSGCMLLYRLFTVKYFFVRIIRMLLFPDHMDDGYSSKLDNRYKEFDELDENDKRDVMPF